MSVYIFNHVICRDAINRVSTSTNDNMEIIETKIKDLIIIKPDVFQD